MQKLKNNGLISEFGEWQHGGELSCLPVHGLVSRTPAPPPGSVFCSLRQCGPGSHYQDPTKTKWV